jgi:D-alanyl-D-alanine carboxypeptidase
MRLLRTPLVTVLAAAALLCALVGASAASAAPASKESTSASACKPDQLLVSSGCVGRRGAQRHIEAMVREAMPELGLRSTIMRVDTGEEPLVNAGFGNSMKGVPASPKMYFRIGSIAIPYLINLLLQLEDEGKLSLNAKLSKYRPNFPEANEVTLRMLADVTSGYPDWIQGNEPFQKQLLENPFRQWTSNELLQWAFTEPVACAPGTCFHYAHTNFAILSQVIAQVTGESVSKLVRERVLAPLGLDHTQVSRYPAMPGEALHAYTGERGVYEDDTFWSPSWSIGDGTIMASPIADVVRGAREIGRGDLISADANAERIAPDLGRDPALHQEHLLRAGDHGRQRLGIPEPVHRRLHRRLRLPQSAGHLGRHRHHTAAAKLRQRQGQRDDPDDPAGRIHQPEAPDRTARRLTPYHPVPNIGVPRRKVGCSKNWPAMKDLAGWGQFLSGGRKRASVSDGPGTAI